MSCTLCAEHTKERGEVMKTLVLTALAAATLGLLGGCDRQPESPGQPNLQARFDQVDANRDGVIEQSEATTVANQPFGEVDTDDNQAISIAEFEAATRNAPAPRG
jgi:hypothetical protein